MLHLEIKAVIYSFRICSNIMMFLESGIFYSDMYLYQLNTEYSLTVIVFWFSVFKVVDEKEGEIYCRNDTSVEMSLYVIESIVCVC